MQKRTKIKIRKGLSKKQLHKQENIFDKKSDRNLIIIGIGLLLIVVAFYGYRYINEQKDKNAYKKYIGLEVPKDVVCMRGDLVMRKTYPVEIEGKTYRACCEKCEKIIENNPVIRLSVDPLTNKSLYKSEAFVILDPNKKGKVTYFDSEDTFLQFKN